MSLVQSLLLKLGMFALTSGIVLWIAWQVPQTMQRPALSPQAGLAQVERLNEPSPAGDALLKAPLTVRELQRVSNEPQLIDLNRASVEDFEQLPGLGPILDRRVVAYRTSMGPFHKVEDLRAVKGIGQKKLERLRRLVTVVPPVASDKGEKVSI